MAILAAVLVPTVTSKIKEANVGSAKSEIGSIISAAKSVAISETAKGNTTMTVADFKAALKAECGSELGAKIDAASKGYTVTFEVVENNTKIKVQSTEYTEAKLESTIDGIKIQEANPNPNPNP